LKEKRFSISTNTSDENFKLALEYLNTAPLTIPNPHTLEKRKDLPDSKDLPKYISIHRFKRNDKEAIGYSVRKHGNFKGKTFISNKLSMEEKLQLAISYLNSQFNNEPLNVQRLDGSGCD
jgi:hypothetical protein